MDLSCTVILSCPVLYCTVQQYSSANSIGETSNDFVCCGPMVEGHVWKTSADFSLHSQDAFACTGFSDGWPPERLGFHEQVGLEDLNVGLWDESIGPYSS